MIFQERLLSLSRRFLFFVQNTFTLAGGVNGNKKSITAHRTACSAVINLKVIPASDNASFPLLWKFVMITNK